MITLPHKIILTYLQNPARALDVVRREVLRGKKMADDISKSVLLKAYHELLAAGKIAKNPELEKLLIKRGVRTLSGVSIITVLTAPYPCPGRCIYCPTEECMPKSYLSDEPAAARALALKFDPYEQVARRIEALERNGHPTDKIELIVKGGSWTAYPLAYQYWFVGRCFAAANSVSLRGVPTKSGQRSNPKALLVTKGLLRHFVPRNDIKKLQKTNEKSKHRIVGLTLETRPDMISAQSIKVMRELGCTRVELGVQSTDDKVLKLIKRGHNTQAVKDATRLLKNSGFKVDYHLMPQLPGTTPARDLKMMLEVFENPDYRPDMIKIYPCTVIKGTELYRWLKSGKYKPYSDKKLIDTIVKFKTQIPRYCRVSRLIRDIPSGHIMGGNKVTNLRQVIQAEMARLGLRCNCLRCREVGHQACNMKLVTCNIKLFVEKYKANDGMEYFLSYEDSKRQVVYAFCRLRLLLKSYKLQVTSYKAYIRELHTYGQMIPIAQTGKIQHTGLGKALMLKAEEICRKNKVEKLAVISGVGVRDYYRHLGYRLEKGYMVKKLAA